MNLEGTRDQQKTKDAKIYHRLSITRNILKCSSFSENIIYPRKEIPIPYKEKPIQNQRRSRIIKNTKSKQLIESLKKDNTTDRDTKDLNNAAKPDTRELNNTNKIKFCNPKSFRVSTKVAINESLIPTCGGQIDPFLQNKYKTPSFYQCITNF